MFMRMPIVRLKLIGSKLIGSKLSIVSPQKSVQKNIDFFEKNNDVVIGS